MDFFWGGVLLCSRLFIFICFMMLTFLLLGHCLSSCQKYCQLEILSTGNTIIQAVLRQKTTPVQEQKIIRINYTHLKIFAVDLITIKKKKKRRSNSHNAGIQLWILNTLHQNHESKQACWHHIWCENWPLLIRIKTLPYKTGDKSAWPKSASLTNCVQQQTDVLDQRSVPTMPLNSIWMLGQQRLVTSLLGQKVPLWPTVCNSKQMYSTKEVYQQCL